MATAHTLRLFNKDLLLENWSFLKLTVLLLFSFFFIFDHRSIFLLQVTCTQIHRTLNTDKSYRSLKVNDAHSSNQMATGPVVSDQTTSTDLRRTKTSFCGAKTGTAATLVL